MDYKNEEIKREIESLNAEIQRLMDLDFDGFQWKINTLLAERNYLLKEYFE